MAICFAVENKEEIDLRAIRLDWLRLQVSRFIVSDGSYSSVLSVKLRLSNWGKCGFIVFIFILGLHKCEQGPSSNKGVPWISKGDEHGPVSHQDGGQCGRTAVGNIWSVHTLVSLLSSPLFLCLILFLFPSFFFILQFLPTCLWEDVQPEQRGGDHEALPHVLPDFMFPLQPVWTCSLPRRGQCLFISNLVITISWTAHLTYAVIFPHVQIEAMEKRTLRLCVIFLEQIAKQTSGVVLEICAEQSNLNDQVKSDSSSG